MDASTCTWDASYGVGKYTYVIGGDRRIEGMIGGGVRRALLNPLYYSSIDSLGISCDNAGTGNFGDTHIQ